MAPLQSARGFSAVIALGDSYTDTGNLPSSPPDYWDGRFSNGPTWVEYASVNLGFAYASYNNLAVSGSDTTELGSQIDQVPGLTTPNDVLFVVWSGNNDFGNHLSNGTSDSKWNTEINDIIANLTEAGDLLYQKGARNLVLFNQVDLTQFPYVRRNYSASFCNYLRSKIQLFNSRLNSAADSLRSSHPGLTVYLFDIYSDFNYLISNYTSYGFSQWTIDALNDPSLSDKSFDGPGANYVFWDSEHPSTKTHNLIAAWLTSMLPASQGPTNTGNPPPAPWNHQDIGNAALAGAAFTTDAGFGLSASGADIYDTSDAFHYMYQPLSGDGSIIARIESVQNTDGYAKAGLMFRESMDAGGRNCLIDLTPGNGAGFQYRSVTNGTTAFVAGPGVAPPYWLKLRRSGNVFSGYTSSDGTNWTLVSSVTAPLSGSLLGGLAVTAHNNYVLNTSQFSHVQVIPDVILPPQLRVELTTNSLPRLTITGTTGLTFRCEISLDGLSWSGLSTNINSSGSVQITDYAATNFNLRFYRAAAYR